MKLERKPYVHAGIPGRLACGTASKRTQCSTKLDQITCPNCCQVYLNYLEQPDAQLRGSVDIR